MIGLGAKRRVAAKVTHAGAAKGWKEVEPGMYVLPEGIWARRQLEAASKPNSLLDDPKIGQLVATLRERYDLDEDTDEVVAFSER